MYAGGDCGGHGAQRAVPHPGAAPPRGRAQLPRGGRQPHRPRPGQRQAAGPV